MAGRARAAAELRLAEAVLGGEVTGLGELGGRHVDADDLAAMPGRERGQEAVGSRAAAEIEYMRLTPREL